MNETNLISLLGCSESCELCEPGSCPSGVTFTCCQTNNCNTFSDIIPTKTVNSCIEGIETVNINTKVKRKCISPVNGFCQVNLIKKKIL